MNALHQSVAAIALLTASGLALSQSGRRYDGPWPPYSRDQCTTAAATGFLSEKQLSQSDCHELVMGEGRRRAAAEAAEGGYVIREFGVWDVDSAGGVEPHAWIVSPSPSDTIKYVDITFRMYNAVGDVVRSEVGNDVSFRIRFTGPLQNSDGPKHGNWGPVGYNHSAACLRPTSVRVDFVSGKRISFTGATLAKAFHPSVNLRCSRQ